MVVVVVSLVMIVVVMVVVMGYVLADDVNDATAIDFSGFQICVNSGVREVVFDFIGQPFCFLLLKTPNPARRHPLVCHQNQKEAKSDDEGGDRVVNFIEMSLFQDSINFDRHV